ncbi:MAG: hypothetical protein DRH89_09150, partial [Candidatus Cloacimonadota bacterium]
GEDRDVAAVVERRLPVRRVGGEEVCWCAVRVPRSLRVLVAEFGLVEGPAEKRHPGAEDGDLGERQVREGERLTGEASGCFPDGDWVAGEVGVGER